MVAEIKKKEKVADEEDVEGEDPEGKPNANTPEIVPAKLKHVDAKLKQATHGLRRALVGPGEYGAARLMQYSVAP